jgi:hypothetical protein
MQKFIISVKDKTTGRDVISPYVLNSLAGLGYYSERVSALGFVVIVDSIKEENVFIELDGQDNEQGNEQGNEKF